VVKPAANTVVESGFDLMSAITLAAVKTASMPANTIDKVADRIAPASFPHMRLPLCEKLPEQVVLQLWPSAV